MKSFRHDYEKAEEAERTLNDAIKNLTKGFSKEENRGYLNVAYDQVKIALATLREYLTEVNERWDTKGDYVRIADTFTEEQLSQIRDEFAGIIGKTENANDELDVINVCQRLLGDPEYRSYDQWKRDTSDVWTEITEE